MNQRPTKPVAAPSTPNPPPQPPAPRQPPRPKGAAVLLEDLEKYAQAQLSLLEEKRKKAESDFGKGKAMGGKQELQAILAYARQLQVIDAAGTRPAYKSIAIPPSFETLGATLLAHYNLPPDLPLANFRDNRWRQQLINHLPDKAHEIHLVYRLAEDEEVVRHLMDLFRMNLPSKSPTHTPPEAGRGESPCIENFPSPTIAPPAPALPIVTPPTGPTELGTNTVLPAIPLTDHPLMTASSGSPPGPEKIELSPGYKDIIETVDAFGLPKEDSILHECTELFAAVSASLPPQTKALKPALLATVVAFRVARAHHLNPSTFAITKHVQARGLEYRDFRDVLLQTAPLFPAPNASALVADSSREITRRLALPALVADGVEHLLRQHLKAFSHSKPSVAAGGIVASAVIAAGADQKYSIPTIAEAAGIALSAIPRAIHAAIQQAGLASPPAYTRLGPALRTTLFVGASDLLARWGKLG